LISLISKAAGMPKETWIDPTHASGAHAARQAPPQPQAGVHRFLTFSRLFMPNCSSSLAADAPPAISIRSVMAGLVLVILLGALEQTIVAVALPVIAGQLHGFALMAWVMSAYLVASTVVTPIYGKLSDMYGPRATLTSAIAIFLLASVGCALAQTMPQLVMMRVLQGLGGGGLISVAQAAIAYVVPLRDRGRYQGYISGVWVLASMAGPVIGGYLTQYLSWRWIFWINLPVGAVAMVVIRQSLRGLVTEHAKRSIDYIGAALFAAGLTMLLIAFTRVGQGMPISESTNLSLLTGAALLLLVFGWHESRVAEQIIPLSLFKDRTVAFCCIALFLVFGQSMALSVLIPLRLQMVGGIAPELAALRLLPLTVAIPLGAFTGGKLTSTTGRYKPFQLTGAVLVTVALYALAFTDPHQGWMLAVVMTLTGFGIGLQLPTGLVATQNAVPQSQVGLATALTAFSRLLGGAVGVAMLTSLLIALLKSRIPVAPLNVGEGDLLATLFHSIIASAAGAHGTNLHAAAESAFRKLLLISATVSLISPLLIACLHERELRGSTPVKTS
jgi:EmrB/QacA subfamily drug resistance transporter